MGNEVSKIENIENFENSSREEIVEITKQDLINASNEQIQVDDIDDTELVVNSVDGNSMVINSHGSSGTDKENDRPNSKVKRRIPKSKSSILTGQLNRDSTILKPGTPKRLNRKESKRASFYQKLKGYNEIMDELITMRNEYELVQQEKIKLREKLAVEEEKQLLSEENHQLRVNGLLAEFKKCKIENDKLKSNQEHTFEEIDAWKSEFEDEKANIQDLIESQLDAEDDIMKLKDDLLRQKQHSDEQSVLMESQIRAHDSEKLKLLKKIENRKRELDHMEGEARARIDEMNKLQKQNMEITLHMDDLKIEKEEVITSNVFLINQLNDKNDTIHALIGEKEEISSEVTKLEVRLEGNRREITNLKRQIITNETEYRTQLNDAEAEFSDERLSFDSEIRQWASKYDELDHQKRRASDEKSELVEERNDLLDKLTFLEKDIGSVHDKLNSVIAENDDKTSSLIDQMKELEVQHLEEKEGFLTRIAELEEVNAVKLQTIESAETARDDLLLRLTSQDVQFNKEKDALHSIISNLEKEHGLLVESVSNIKGERDDLELKMTSMQQDLDSIEGLEIKTRALEVSNENLLSEIDQLKAEIEQEKIYHNEELMKIIGEMNQAQESNSELKGMNKDLAKQITKQQELLNIHQQASDQYLNQITVLDDKVNYYVEEIDSQKSRLKEFEKERFHLQTEMIDLQDENQRLREKEATSAEMTLIETDSHESMVSAIKTIETENTALKTSNDGFVENSKLLALKNNDLQAKVDNLLNELSRIRDQEEFLRGESIKRQNLENQNSALVSKLNTLKSSDENLRSKLAETERKEDNLRHLNTKLVQRLSLFKECKTQLDAQKEAVAQ